MNKLIYILVVVFMLSSCTAPEVRPFVRIEGEWICQSFEYRTENGLYLDTDTVDFHVIFENCNDKKDEDPERCEGKIFSDEKQYDFKYLASIASGNKDVLNITVDSAILSSESYPIEFIGLSNVYTIRYQGKDGMELQADDQEWFTNHDTGERIDRLKWTFKKQ